MDKGKFSTALLWYSPGKEEGPCKNSSFVARKIVAEFLIAPFSKRTLCLLLLKSC